MRRLPRISLSALAVSSLVLVTLALALIFFVVPNDANQGFSQRIFYFHVSIALTAYACFIGGAWKALVHLWKHDPRADLESYVAVHQGVIFGVLVLVTGSIWAKISWGHWWLWSEDQLVLFLVLFLFYAAYFMLRFSVDPGPQQANFSAVYALFGVVLIPVSFAAIRLAKGLIHPVVFTRHGPNFHGWILATYCVAQVAMLVLAYTLYRVELTGKRIDARLRELRMATPAGSSVLHGLAKTEQRKDAGSGDSSTIAATEDTAMRRFAAAPNSAATPPQGSHK